MKSSFSNTKTLLTVSLAVSLGLLACKGENKQEATPAETQTEVAPAPTPEMDAEHNAQTSLDYAGTYKGVTPCADCSGIEVELTINADSTYTHSSKYLGKGDGKPVVKTGKYTWADGNTIQLDNTDGPSKYKVGEGRIWQLDLQGNKVEGELADKYILTKI